MRRIEFKIRNKVVGTYDRLTKTYTTLRNKHHYFIKFKGFGVSTEILLKLRKLGCNKIIIIYNKADGTQTVYQTYPEKFLTEGYIWTDGELDHQRILPTEKINMKNDKKINLQQTLQDL